MNTNINLPEGIPPLNTYYMYITSGCNLACRHCWITPTFEASGGTGQCLDFMLFEMAVNQALPLGLATIKFTGGEPLLHPDFARMADFATEQGLTTWMETNGTLITSELAIHLKEKTSLHSVSVSLDGATAATHEHMRNVQGSFDRAKNGVISLIAAGYHPQIVMSLYPGNVNEIEELVRWAESSGCNSVKFNLVQPSGRGVQMKDRGEWLDIGNLIQIGRWIEKELQPRVHIPLLYSWPLAFQGIDRLTKSVETCNIQHILGVLSTGHLAMCGIGTQEQDLVYGKLGEDNVSDVWSYHPALLRTRQAASFLEGICSNCIHKRICLGNCMAQNYYTSKRMRAPFWFCQIAEDGGLFPPTRKIATLTQIDKVTYNFVS
jgi:SynChlorMet cassette radical SAM/SPASM protein ScmF